MSNESIERLSGPQFCSPGRNCYENCSGWSCKCGCHCSTESPAMMPVAEHQRIVKELEARVEDLENRSHQTVLFECGCMFRQDGLDAEPQLISHCVAPFLSDAVREVGKMRNGWDKKELAHVEKHGTACAAANEFNVMFRAANEIIAALNSLGTQREGPQ